LTHRDESTCPRADTFGKNGITPANPAYAFADQADIVVNLRLAADAAGATRVDRLEWGAVDPRSGEAGVKGPTRSAGAAGVTSV
jgi:uncharacterized protein